ncbi:MAG: hypothetical protein BroJett015_19650 [Chloroflexota bacterium]|nr:MAG: hypothetical protein BroJett015_19650 [Chloroflexota bacterium]
MVWSDVRNNYPNQWLIIEALEAHTTANSQRQLDRIAVVEKCVDGNSAMEAYRRLHQLYPSREFYFVHTGREKLDIRERQWLGVRSSRHEVSVER